MRSLIVEDEFTSRMLLKYYLEEYGTVDVAVNGTEAVDAYKMVMTTDNPYNLICLDINLPEKDGHEALVEIRGIQTRMTGYYKKTDVKIFMTTALANMKSAQDAAGLCDEYLLKPIDKNILQERLIKHKLIKAEDVSEKETKKKSKKKTNKPE